MNVFCWRRVEAAEQRQPVAGVEQDVVAEARPRPRVRQAAPRRAAAARRPRRSRRGRRRAGRAAAGRAPRTDHGRQASRSSGVGRFAGGAQRTAAAIQASRSASPSPRWVEVGWLAKPVRCSDAEQPVARAVAGEHAAGAVAAVRRGREAVDQHARLRVAEAGDRRAPVLLVGVRRAALARDLLAPRDEPRAAAADDDPRLERGEAGRAQPVRPRSSAPSMSRVITGSRAVGWSGRPVRSWRDDELDRGADHGERVVGGRERRRAVAPAPCARCRGAGRRRRPRGSRRAARAARGPGADDLDEQRLRGVAVVGERVEERADAGRDVLVVAAVRALLPGRRHRVRHLRGGLVEEREDALLLVGEVLVERRLRHPGLAADRLGARLRVADAREDRRRGLEQPLALHPEPDVERRRVAAAGDGRRSGEGRPSHANGR